MEGSKVRDAVTAQYRVWHAVEWMMDRHLVMRWRMQEARQDKTRQDEGLRPTS